MPSATLLLSFATAVSLLAASAAPAGATAAAPVAQHGAPLARLVGEARARHPAIEAARLRWLAARRRVPGEGLLPDPMVGASLMNLPRLQGPQLTVSQTFPLGGRLDLARRQADLEVEVARLAYLGQVSRVVTAVKVAYHEAHHLQWEAAVVGRTKELMKRMGRIASTRYAVGTGKQGDPLRANVQVAELLEEALRLRQRSEAVTARLRGLLALPPGATVAIPAAAEPRAQAALPAPPGLVLALAAAEAHNPDIAEAQAMVAVEEATLALAGTTASPELAVQLGLGRVFMDMGWETALSGMVGVNLPFPHGQTRREAAVGAGQSALAARRSLRDDRRRQVRAELEETLSQLGSLAERWRLYQRGVMPQARQALAAELANYTTGRSDFDAWLAAQLSLYRYERAAHEAITDYHKLRAELDALTGDAVAGLEEGP